MSVKRPPISIASAVEIQHGMIERNAPEPQDKRIEFRIGIHVGDVIIEECEYCCAARRYRPTRRHLHL
jgi:class 3 adenylate cyclase